MINRETIKYSLRNMKKSKERNFLTIFSILIGITTIFIFISFGLGLYNYVDEMFQGSSADKIVIQAKGIGMPGSDLSFKLDNSDLKAIEKVRGVATATGTYYRTVGISQKGENKYTFLVSYDPKVPIVSDLTNIEILNGRDLRGKDKGNAVLGYGFTKDGTIFDKGYKINDKIKTDFGELKIVGFYEEVGSPTDDAQMYITNEYFEELYPEESSYAMIIVKVENKNEINQITERIEKELRKNRDQKEGQEDFFVQSFEEMMETYSSALDIVIGFIILIALISILVSSVNTANTMITSVLERYKEIGVLKAIGAKNSDIFGIFLFESSVLGLTAGIIGVFFGIVFSYIGKIILINLGWSFLSPLYSVELILGCILFAMITGAISGVIPALRASKISAVKAIRYE